MDKLLPNSESLLSVLSALYLDSEQLHRATAALQNLGLVQGGVDGRIEEADVDLLRPARCGFPEVIYGQNKSPELVLEIVRRQQAAGQNSFATRIATEHAELVRTEFPEAVHNALARTLRIGSRPMHDRSPGPVFVVTAGSSDRPVAEEALETLKWMQVECSLLCDLGVAGPHRLQQHVPRLQKAVAIVCVAGMEAALPSVLGGYVACPVIGVPVSVGYGASFGGVTAMLSMLTCCSSNVVCVNIDAGFKGGYVAGLIAAQAGRI